MAGGPIGDSIRSLDRASDSRKMTIGIAPSSAEMQLDGELLGRAAPGAGVVIDTATLTVRLSDPSRDGG